MDIRYSISVQVKQTVVHREALHSEDCACQFCSFIFIPNSTETAEEYTVVITAASGDQLYLTNNFTIPQTIGNYCQIMLTLYTFIYYIPIISLKSKYMIIYYIYIYSTS